MNRKRYGAEFKREAARLMIIDGVSTPEVSERLGVKTGLLYRWKREHLEEMDATSAGAPGASAAQMAVEIEGLRKRLAKAERINQILKKR